MKWVLNILGIIFIVVGLVWILQGVNILPGSFMTGNMLYAILGLALDVIGIIMLYLVNRRRAGMR